jgi:DNA-binding NarL/FixJ family response regulator
MSIPLKIFIVDDHPMVRDGLTGYLDNALKYEIVGEAGDGAEALERIKNIEVDLVLTDVKMPKMDGIELTKALLKMNPDQRIIAMTMFNDAHYIKKMLHAGVKGYLLKSAGENEIQLAIEMVMQGDSYYSPEVTAIIMNKLRGQSKKPVEGIESLTSREKEVLYLILKQQSNQEIGDALFISPRTVEAHKRNLLEKTGSKNIAGLVIYAVDKGIFSDF